MSEYLKRLIDRDLQRSDWASMARRMEAMAPLDIASEEIVRVIREERESR